MKSKESEYRELFLVEAKDNIEQLDKLFVDLEKDHNHQTAISEIFRITHTLKGNAMGLGIDAVADLAHVMEDVMISVKSKRLAMNDALFKLLFRANDKLGDLVTAIETGEKVSFLGIKTSLAIFLKNELGKDEEEGAAPDPESEVDEDETAEESERDGGTSNQISFSDVIQIPVKKMDDLLSEVGQLIIERDRLIAFSNELGLKSSEFDRLQRISSNLQYSIMNARMVQVGFLFNKFHRVLRDAASIEGKKASLVLKGSDTEIDRNILKLISDSLVHLVRNAVSHGIESEAERKKANKPLEGQVTLDARYERDRVVIIVKDDGGGIDHEVIRRKIVEKGLATPEMVKMMSKDEVLSYIFESGFSNAAKVNELSGRGVGMDVVKKAVESIGGQVKLETEVGKGATIYLHVPASLALKGSLLFEIDKQEYALALSYTEAVVSIPKREINKISGGLMGTFQDEAISIIFLKDIIKMKSLSEISSKGALHRSFLDAGNDSVFQVVIVSYAGNITGLVVDKVLQQKEIIEKPLTKPIDRTKLLSGTTILGNGNVCPVIDVAVVTDLIHKQSLQTQLEQK
ncbi:MAG: chemotaxis protein CheA [Marinoscillum sp.]